MAMIVMLITLNGSYGFVGAAPVIQGFKTMNACQNSIPKIKTFYGPGIEKIQCLSLPNGT